jgi:hypothetical protein
MPSRWWTPHLHTFDSSLGELPVLRSDGAKPSKAYIMTTLDPQLIACADDVSYELRMIGVLGQLKTPTDLPFVGYGLLESLLLHVRLLDDFLGNRRRRGPKGDDDLTAKDYNSSWSTNGFLKRDERSAINKRLAHLTRSRRDHKADQRWRTGGALDAKGNWHRIDLAKRALASFTNFIETLSPEAKELFEPALTDAWKYHLAAYEVNAYVLRPKPTFIRAMVEDNRVVRVWVGTSQYVIQDADSDP